VALGTTLAGAVALAREVENLAGQYLDLLAAGLDPVLLEDSELAEAAAQLKGYGRPA
jgi:L-fuculose-phosphate aldolase